MTHRTSKSLTSLLTAGLDRVYTAAAVQVRYRGRVLYQRAVGRPNPEASGARTHLSTLFDLASLTKLFTATVFLTLVEEKRVSLDTRVSEVLPEFTGTRPIRPYEHPLKPGEWVTIEASDQHADAGHVTFRHILAHTAGLPAWRPLFRLPRESIRPTVLNTFFACRPGTHVVYSDLGFMLLGWAVEALSGLPLDQAIRHRVSLPLKLPTLAFRPASRAPFTPDIAATEVCAQRGRRVWGEVHDENAWTLGGISGHAGLFATVTDVGAFGQAWLDRLRGQGALPLSTEQVQEAVREQAREGDVRRGLGWALRSSNPDGFSYPLGDRSFGHTGFTGTSLYIDPEREAVITALTNRVYFGRDAEGITAWRRDLHTTVISLIDGEAEQDDGEG